MVDTPTARYGARKQSLGSNVNTWGDTKLNDVIDLLDRGSKGFQSLAITGDTTLSWTNYSASNDGQVSTLELTGSLSSACNLVVPSKQWDFTVINNAGQTVTVKTAAGTGVAIPTGRQALLYCDASDVDNRAPVILPTYTPTGNYEATHKLYVDTAIATASLPATAGTLLVSGSDTTAGYLRAKLTVQVSGALTLQISTLNPGANEQVAFSGSVGTLGLTDGGIVTGTFSATSNYKYRVNATAAVSTATMPASPTVGDIMMFSKYGSYVFTLNLNGLKYYGSTANPQSSDRGITILQYIGTTDGWIDL